MTNPQTTTNSTGLSCEGSTESYAYLDTTEWSGISDLELLATLFSLASCEGQAPLLAEKALHSAGSLSQLVHLPPAELRCVFSESPRVLALINLLRLGMHRAVNERTSEQLHIRSHNALTEYISLNKNPTKSGDRRIILLDQDSRLVRDLSISISGTHAVACRVIAQRALEADAFGLIVVDYLYRKKIRISSKLDHLYELISASMMNISVCLYDYIIVGIDEFYSKKDNKIIRM